MIDPFVIYLLLLTSSFSISFALIAICMNSQNSIFFHDNCPQHSDLNEDYKSFFHRYPLEDIMSLEDKEQQEYTNDYSNIVFRDETPSGDVIIKYDHDNHCFDYYADKYVTNKILEVLCRGLVLQYECKEIYTNYFIELTNRKVVLDNVEKKLDEKEETNNAENSVFATFKSYNKKEKDAHTSDILIKKNFNKFKNRGKLCDFESYETKKFVQEYETISYDDFVKSKKK